MKFCPGVVPQCPSSMCLMSVSASGRFSSGLSSKINLADREIVRGPPVSVHLVEQFRSEGVGFHVSIPFFTTLNPRTRHTERAIMSSSSVRMTRTVTRALSAEITAAFLAFRALSDFDTEKIESFTNAGADKRRIFADAAGEDERVQSTERGGVRADPLFRLITKQRHGFRRAHVFLLMFQASRACQSWFPKRRANPTRGSPFCKTGWWSSARCAPDTARGRDPNRRSACSSPIPPSA